MKKTESISIVSDIMREFADLTGLSPGRKTPRRYLWTDAFAVCNFLGLYQQANERQFIELAVRLIDQVHRVLGRYRDDDQRTGWISGLEEQKGSLHPTAGGLRIGKGMNERGPGEPFDEGLEWERDGQYYHYLTKWMHALDRTSRVTGDTRYHLWAIELAKAAHSRFTYGRPGRRRMYWKMSTDLSYPLVSSMGHHDPLDGLITYLQLQANDTRASRRSDLTSEIEDMAAMCRGKSWATDDPLGIGELLGGSYRLAQLIFREGLWEEELLGILLDSSLVSLEAYARGNQLKLPADYRLAFRELGLSIGLHAVQRMLPMIVQGLDEKNPLGVMIREMTKYAELGDAIETFWREPSHRRAESWMQHRDINMVMLATSLASDGYLTL